jgi:hypothetical protein
MTGRIPSVHAIAGHHQVSHRVAARALEMLRGEGMIENVPGGGTSSVTPGGSRLRCVPRSPDAGSRRRATPGTGLPLSSGTAKHNVLVSEIPLSCPIGRPWAPDT